MQNFRSSGDRILFTAGATIHGGEPLLIGVTVGVALQDYASGDTGCVLVVGGEFQFAALSTDTPAQGAKAYWDVGNRRMTTTAGANVDAGVFTQAKANGVATCTVRMRSSF